MTESSFEGGKSVLICPSCGHESSVVGDWIVGEERESGRERTTYACPDCDETIASRPAFAASAR